jgi:ABC-type branched-subunit amino acid transport system ATPase component
MEEEGGNVQGTHMAEGPRGAVARPDIVPTAADGPATVVENLAKSYGATRAVDGLSFTVAPGEVFALLGPNGAGKTTTLEIMEGYRTPDSGVVRVLGLDPRRDARRLKMRTGVMLQQDGLYPGLTTREILRLYASFFPHPADPEKLLGRVGLRDAATTAITCERVPVSAIAQLLQAGNAAGRLAKQDLYRAR